MEQFIEKEFSIGDLFNLLITRNTQNILELKFTSTIKANNILVMSFYDSDKNIISQKNLKFICNYKNIFFDNILLISNLKEENQNQEYKIKISNDNISYMKLYIQIYNVTNKKENNFSQIFELNEMRILTKEEANNLFLNNINKEKNNNLNMIISELDKVNKTLNKRKKELDEKEKNIKEMEYHINKNKKIIEQKIIQFKEEMLLFGDKCYGECMNEVNNKIKKLNKKINSVENNVTNKYLILKDKLNNNKINNNINNNNIISQEKKEKIANLEIKIKFLEDNINKLKEKNIENEEKIKNYILNEEKNNITIKKLKDELIILNSQIKEKKLKINNNINNSNISISNISIIDNKENKIKKKDKINFDLDKNQKEIISKYFVYDFILEYNLYPNNYIDKDILSMSLLLMHLSTNPIELYNKFDIGHIILLQKIINNIYLNKINSYKLLLKDSLIDLYNKLPEFKNNISVFINNNSNKKNYNNEFKPFIDIIINDINLSNVIYNKCISFNNFIIKNNNFTNKRNCNNERKNKIKKYTIISNILLSLLFCSNINELNLCIKQIIEYFNNINKDEEIFKFLIKIKFGKILILIYDKIIENNNNINVDIKNLNQNIFDCILYNISLLNNKNNKDEINNDIGIILFNNKFEYFLKSNLQEFICYLQEKDSYNLDDYNIKNNCAKIIILITNLSIYCNELRNKIKETFMKDIINIKSLIKNNQNKKNKKDDYLYILLNKNISILSKIIKT